MTKKREKYLKNREEKRKKTEEGIKNGTIRYISHEQKKEKQAMPNRKSLFASCDQELADRQETAERAVMVYQRMMKGLLPKLSLIKDPRQPSKIKHKMNVLFVYGILLSMYHIGSRRRANLEMSRPIFHENLKEMFPTLESLPHADTLARLLENLDVEMIQEAMIRLLKDLIKNKKFKNYLHNKKLLIAIDGTQKLCRGYHWADECLKRHVGESRVEQYYCYVLEAVMVLDNGITLPLISEFIENDKQETSGSKQDCELKGFYRMTEHLKRIFRNTKISIVVDGLYACGPVISICRKYNWDYMIVLKEESMPAVWDEAMALINLNKENRCGCMWGDREQRFAWANEIEYEYNVEAGKRKEIINVVICYESWKETHARTTHSAEIKQTRYAWISSKAISDSNVFYRCTRMGRFRWKIENSILTEKHQGYLYEHCYSYSWNAMKGFHFLMKIGRFMNVMAANSELLYEKVKELGIRGFVRYMRNICQGALLDKEGLREARERQFMWRLQVET